MDGVGDLLGGGGIDGRAVNEETFLGDGGKFTVLQDAVEDVLDMARFGKTGDDDFL